MPRYDLKAQRTGVISTLHTRYHFNLARTFETAPRRGCGDGACRSVSESPRSCQNKRIPFDIVNWVNRTEQILLSRQHQPHPHTDDRQRIDSARQAAEALFTSKPPVSAPSVADTAPADQAARKPRVLRIISPEPARHQEPETPDAPEPSPTPSVPASQVARIRTWVRYGLTVHQVAKVYGVPIGEIERVLRHA